MSSSSLTPRQEKIKTSRFPTLWYVAFAPLFVVLLFAGTAWGLRTYQAHEYESMLAQARTHQPLYYNALNAPTGDWSLTSRLGTKDLHAVYAENSYQITAPLEAVAWTIHRFGDALVEVTARMMSSDQYDSLGLVLHAGSLDELITFQISPSGYWEVGLGYFPDEGQNIFHKTDAINSAFGAANRLSVIMRGNEYICFVNDHFVGIYQDSQTRSGQVGVLLEANATAAFSDFTVYPLA